MRRAWRKLSHEPVAFWTGLLTIAEGTLTSTGVFPQLAGILTTVITVLGGVAVRQSVSPVAALGDDTNPQMGQP